MLQVLGCTFLPLIRQDPTAAPAPDFTPPRGLLGFFQSTGIVGFVLLAVLVSGIVAIARRWRDLSRARLGSGAGIAEIGDSGQDGGPVLAGGASRTGAGCLGRLVRSARLHEGDGLAEMIEALERAAARETASLHDRMRGLARLGILSALLGAFGTTAGLIASFQVLATIKAPEPSHYAVAVAESLASLAIGLFFAALLIGVSFLLRARATRLVASLAAEAEELIRRRPPDQGGRG